MKRIPKTKEDFVWVNWTPTEIEKVADEILARKRQLYDAIKKIPTMDRTFENTVYGIEATGDAMAPINFIEILLNVSPIEDVRKSAEKAIKKIQEELVDIEYDPGLYQAVKEFAETLEAKQLTGEDKKLFDDMLRDYRRMGFDLPLEKQVALKSIIKKLQKFQTEYTLNINNYKDHILVTREELDGLSENYVKSLEMDEVTGKYRVSLRAPEFLPFVENATNASKRKELTDKNLHKGGQANIDILKEVLPLRQAQAELLGYKNYVDYAAEPRMAKSGKIIKDFLDDLINKVGLAKDRDLVAILEAKRTMTGDPKAELEYFDVWYYIRQLEKQLFNFDKEKLRDYFPLETVKNGIFEIYGKLFSINFEEVIGYPTWHPDARLYVVKNQNDQSVAGYVFMDLHPRNGKYSHQSMWPLVNGHRDGYKSEDYITPLATIIGNFPKPTSDLPSLLNHNEVEIFFHEFGHIMHGILTSASYVSQSGTSVAWDFVEVPSQMLEHWVWDKDMLNILSGHYKNPNEKLSSEILDNMLSAKDHMAGYVNMNQLVLGLYNHILHAGSINENITGIYNDLRLKYFGIKLPEDNIFAAGFGHLIGYAGAYYSYMWSKVYECDLFTRFKIEGLLNPKTGADYRSWILEKGSSLEPIDLIRGFLGREPNNKAFLEEIGIKE